MMTNEPSEGARRRAKRKHGLEEQAAAICRYRDPRCIYDPCQAGIYWACDPKRAERVRRDLKGITTDDTPKSPQDAR